MRLFLSLIRSGTASAMIIGVWWSTSTFRRGSGGDSHLRTYKLRYVAKSYYTDQCLISTDRAQNCCITYLTIDVPVNRSELVDTIHDQCSRIPPSLVISLSIGHQKKKEEKKEKRWRKGFHRRVVRTVLVTTGGRDKISIVSTLLFIYPLLNIGRNFLLLVQEPRLFPARNVLPYQVTTHRANLPQSLGVHPGLGRIQHQPATRHW